MSSLITLNYLLKAAVAVGVNRPGHADAFDVALTKFNESMIHLSAANQKNDDRHANNWQRVRVRGSGHPFRFPRLCEHGKDKSIRTNPPGATVATQSMHNEEKRHGTSCRQRRGVIYVLSYLTS